MSTPSSPSGDSTLVQPAASPRRPPNAGKGRKKGVPNRTTQAFRETVQALLDDNRENVALWLKQTAEGSRNRKVGGKTIPGRPPDPAGAARLLAQLAEFAAPKLNRSEVVGEGGGPLTVVIRKEA
jgi:hypothetical protein